MKKTGKKFFRDLLVKIGGGLFAASAALMIPGAVPAVADDEAKVTVAGTVDSSRVAVGEPFELRIQIRSEAATMSGVGNPRLPDLDGFRVEGSPSRSMQTQISIINGQITPLVTQEFTFTLIPERQGSIVIGAAEILVDDKKYSTQPIRMQVGPAGSAPRSRGAQQRGRPSRPGGIDPFSDPDDIFDQMLRRHGLGGGGGGMDDDGPPLNEREAFFIRLIVDKDEAYVGEQITASWYLYTRNEVRNIDSLKYPDLKGFWKEDIDRATGLVFEDDVVNGVRFRRAPLMSFALFPLKEGTAIIDPYKVKCTVVQGSAFGFGRPFTFTKISPEKKIRVLPIPAGSPREFTGAVGDFEIRSSVASTKIVVGQPFSVKVKIEGRGNAKMIEFPPWELPKSLEQFEVKSDSKFFRTGESYKEFEVLLIPRVAGPVTLPELGFSAFDPKTRSFVRKVAPAIAINVVTGSGGDNFQNQRMAENKGSAEKTADALPQAVMSF
ncbi:MAG: BatD family protein, partial [Bdellovibrionales bacterium]|nr:BatD family protein [Bdellovibrionales bacterium]